MTPVRERTAWRWEDPRAWEANASGRLTPEQRELIVGPPVRRPYLAWTFLVWLVLTEAGAAVVGALDPGSGGLGGALAAMGLVMLIWGWQALTMGLVIGVPRWRARRRRRRMSAAVADGRVVDGAGYVTERGEVRAGLEVIPVPPGAPPLPPPGDYRLFWLESPAGVPGPLLSARPLPDDPS